MLIDPKDPRRRGGALPSVVGDIIDDLVPEARPRSGAATTPAPRAAAVTPVKKDPPLAKVPSSSSLPTLPKMPSSSSLPTSAKPPPAGQKTRLDANSNLGSIVNDIIDDLVAADVRAKSPRRPPGKT